MKPSSFKVKTWGGINLDNPQDLGCSFFDLLNHERITVIERIMPCSKFLLLLSHTHALPHAFRTLHMLVTYLHTPALYAYAMCQPPKCATSTLRPCHQPCYEYKTRGKRVNCM